MQIDRPDFINGFAPRDCEPQFPELWNRRLYSAAPCLGPTGTNLFDWSGRGALTSMSGGIGAHFNWAVSQGQYCFTRDNGIATGMLAGNPSYLQFSGAITVSAWFNCTTQTSSGYLFSKSNGSSTGWSLQWNSGPTAIRFWIFSGGALKAATASSVYNDGKWHHALGKSDGVNVYLYIDGKQVASAASGIMTADTASALALTVNSAQTVPSDGLSDDFAVYDYAMPDDLIALLATRRGIAYEPRVRTRRIGIASSGMTITVTDSGIGTDLLASISASGSTGDSGSGADTVNAPAASLGVPDTGLGADALAAISGAITAADASGGVDQVASLIVSAAVSDAGSVADTPVISALLQGLIDSCVGADSIFVSFFVGITDSGQGADSVAPCTIQLTVPETCSGNDLLAAIAVALSIADASGAVDGITVQTVVGNFGRVVTITFTALQRSVSFAAGQRAVTLAAAQRSITIKKS